jgi:hypothetical protein
MPEFDFHRELSSSCRKNRRVSANQMSNLPSPYTNYLQIQKFNIYAACVQNALRIGMPLQFAGTQGLISRWYWDPEFTASLLTSGDGSNEIRHETCSPLGYIVSNTGNCVIMRLF